MNRCMTGITTIHRCKTRVSYRLVYFRIAKSVEREEYYNLVTYQQPDTHFCSTFQFNSDVIIVIEQQVYVT